jgi:hypothetical protein
MKTLTTFFLLATTATAALADDSIVTTAPPPRTVGVDGVAVLPLGDYGQVASLAVGALGRIEVPAGDGYVTGRAGLVVNSTTGTATDTSLLMVPLYGGYRLPVGHAGGYIAGELGLTYITAGVDTQLGRMSVSSTKLGLTVGGGWRRGGLDIRGALFAPDLGQTAGLMASVGYDFVAF